MVLKLVLKLVVIFSLINSIQCACRGSEAIQDAIHEVESRLVDAISGVSERIQTIESTINCTTTPPVPIG